MKKTIKTCVLFFFLSTTAIYASFIKPNPSKVEIAGGMAIYAPFN